MDNKNPLCPYCGPWNGHPDGMEMKLHEKIWHYRYDSWHYLCPVCSTCSPASSSKEEAINSAIRRFQPMQKPMRIVDVEKHVCNINERPLYIEFNSSIKGQENANFIYSHWRNHANITNLVAHEEKYNVEFRFWWEEPTTEERAAAKWEE